MQFPPSMICVGDIDPLVDDSTILYKRLFEAGAQVTLMIGRSLPHGFANMASEFPLAPQMISSCADFINSIAHSYKTQLVEML